MSEQSNATDNRRRNELDPPSDALLEASVGKFGHQLLEASVGIVDVGKTLVDDVTDSVGKLGDDLAGLIGEVMRNCSVCYEHCVSPSRVNNAVNMLPVRRLHRRRCQSTGMSSLMV